MVCKHRHQTGDRAGRCRGISNRRLCRRRSRLGRRWRNRFGLRFMTANGSKLARCDPGPGCDQHNQSSDTMKPEKRCHGDYFPFYAAGHWTMG